MKGAWQVTMYVFFTWTLSILASPIMNMMVSESCPQLVFTFFSNLGRLFWSLLGIALFIDFCFLLCMILYAGQEGREAAGSSICGIFGAALKVADALEKKAKENPNSDNFLVNIVRLMSLAVPLVPLGAFIFTVLYNAIIFFKFTKTIVLGLNMNLALRFPGFKLSKEINTFHVFFFMLWMLDSLNFTWNQLAKFRFMRERMENIQIPAAVVGRGSV